MVVDGGTRDRIPTDLLQLRPPHTSSQLASSATESPIVIPFVEEQLQVAKRILETGKVRLEKSAEAYEVRLDEPLVVLPSWRRARAEARGC